jgi:hypothetical protein
MSDDLFGIEGAAEREAHYARLKGKPVKSSIDQAKDTAIGCLAFLFLLGVLCGVLWLVLPSSVTDKMWVKRGQPDVRHFLVKRGQPDVRHFLMSANEMGQIRLSLFSSSPGFQYQVLYSQCKP